MKNSLINITLGLCWIFLVAGCKSTPPTNEDKAKKIIVTDLKNKIHILHIFPGYESLNFGQLDSVFSDLGADLKYQKLMEKHNQLMKESDENLIQAKKWKGVSQSKFNYYRALNFKILDTMKEITGVVTQMAEEFIPSFIGWKMKHTFRAKDANGNQIIYQFEFYFNKSVNVLMGVNEKAGDLIPGFQNMP